MRATVFQYKTMHDHNTEEHRSKSNNVSMQSLIFTRLFNGGESTILHYLWSDTIYDSLLSSHSTKAGLTTYGPTLVPRGRLYLANGC